MNETTTLVSNSAIAAMVISMLVTTLGPIVLLFLWRAKVKKHLKDYSAAPAANSLMPALAGALTFVIAALVLESIPKSFLFSGTNAVSVYILNHAWAYTLTAALLAGIFEECGRYVTMRFILTKHTAKEASVTFGIGHGGIESILIIGIGMFSNLVLATMINNGSVAVLTNGLSPEQAALYHTSAAALAGISPGTFLIGIWERIFAVLLHISLSVFVFAAVKMKHKFYFLPLSILLHALLDVFAGLFQFGVLSVAVTEICIAVLSTGCAVLAYRVYRQLDSQESL